MASSLDSKSIYTERIDRVTDYMRSHLDRSSSLDELAGVAYLSSFHFHRIFTAITGETVNAFTNRLRLEKAARLLKYSKNSLTEIALNCGFSSSSTFSRSFKKYFGLAPSEYRKTGVIENSKICKDFHPVEEYVIPMSDEELETRFPVEIRRFPERRVVFIRVIDAYGEDRVLRAFERLVKWAKEQEFFETGTFFGMSLDDPQVTPAEKYRYEVCLTVAGSARLDLDPEISEMTLPALDYAVTRVSGDIKIVATATEYLFNKWLINSRFEPEHQPALEIFLDKESVCNWEHFDLDLCVPVRPLRRI
ncbi:MAG: AraC family transcriptional regulator [Pyrinomonadaceae bacterium]|nr:AraC family transcriptional regulator [Pyrinomonadaceae bacterium]